MKKFLLFFLIIFTGCTAIKQQIGQRDIKKGIASYQENGMKLENMDLILEGLKWYPDSIQGNDLLNQEYHKLKLITKNLISKPNIQKNDYTINNNIITNLITYILINEKYQKIIKENEKSIFHNSEDFQLNRKEYFKEKQLFMPLLDSLISEENISHLNRTEKIEKLVSYKKLYKYAPTDNLSRKIKALEKEININLYFKIQASRGYYNHDIMQLLNQKIDRYKNKDLGNYLFIGDTGGYNIVTLPNSYLVQIKISDFDYKTNKKEIVSKNAIYLKTKITIRGDIKVINILTGETLWTNTIFENKNVQNEVGPNISKELEISIERMLENTIEDVIHEQISRFRALKI